MSINDRPENRGALPFDPETEEQLQEACAQIEAMRRDLVQALGFKEVPR